MFRPKTISAPLTPLTLLKCAEKSQADTPSVFLCSSSWTLISDNWLYSCQVKICLVVFQEGQPIALLPAHVSTHVVSCLTLCEFTTRLWPLRLRNQTLLMILRQLCHGAGPRFHRVPAPQGTPQPLYQTLAAPIVVGSSLLSPVLEGLGESEWGGVQGPTSGDPAVSHIPAGSCWRQGNKRGGDGHRGR